MTEKNKATNRRKRDPLRQLEVIEDNVPLIETEKDPLEIMEQNNSENIPEYDSESGSIIKTEAKDYDESEDLIEEVIEPKEEDVEDSPLFKAINEVVINQEEINDDEIVKNQAEIKEEAEEIIKELEAKPKTADKTPVDDMTSDSTDETLNETLVDDMTSDSIDETLNETSVDDITSDSIDEILDETPLVESTENIKPQESKITTSKLKDSSDNKKSKTHMIDEVKVDENGVPLLNQFDSEKINKLRGVFKSSKHNISKITSIVIGLVLMVYGTYQAFNDSVKISDSVMYGEHETMAIAFIAMGILIILLSFYTEIMRYLGLNQSEEIHESSIDEDE